MRDAPADSGRAGSAGVDACGTGLAVARSGRGSWRDGSRPTGPELSPQPDERPRRHAACAAAGTHRGLQHVRPARRRRGVPISPCATTGIAPPTQHPRRGYGALAQALLPADQEKRLLQAFLRTLRDFHGSRGIESGLIRILASLSGRIRTSWPAATSRSHSARRARRRPEARIRRGLPRPHAGTRRGRVVGSLRAARPRGCPRRIGHGLAADRLEEVAGRLPTRRHRGPRKVLALQPTASIPGSSSISAPTRSQ